jgi:DNA replication protein DnaC
MLDNATIEKLYKLQWEGFLKALEEQNKSGQYVDLRFMDRLGMLLDREIDDRENKQFLKTVKRANMRHQACVEDIDYKIPRNLDQSVILSLASCLWITKGQNVLITGPTGVGKSYIACALGQKACINNMNVKYFRMSVFLDEMANRRKKGTFGRFIAHLGKIPLLILDDFGLQELGKQDRLDFLDILDDRIHRRSTMIVAQLPTKHWHEMIGDSTVADAILDRFIHNSHEIEMDGESMRKHKHSLT